MAKVTGPLFSMSASGKIGNAMVHFAWKGINVVRSFVIPANPMSGDQGDQRLILGGVGRAVGKIGVGSDYHNQLIALGAIPTGQTKQSAVVKAIIDLYCSDATAYEAQVTAFNAHGAKADFTTAAGTLTLADFDVAYKATSNSFAKGLMVYLLAKYAIDADFTGSPYTTALASWTSTEINAMVADLASA